MQDHINNLIAYLDVLQKNVEQNYYNIEKVKKEIEFQLDVPVTRGQEALPE